MGAWGGGTIIRESSSILRLVRQEKMHRGGALRKCVCVRVCSLQNCVLYIYS